MAMTPDELQAMFVLTQALIRVEKQLRHVEGEVERVQDDVSRIAMRLLGDIRLDVDDVGRVN